MKKKKKEELSSYDRRLLEVIVAQRQVPQELLKLKREIQAHVKRCPKKNSIVGKEFIELELLKPGILEVIGYSSSLREQRKKKVPLKEKKMTSVQEMIKKHHIPQAPSVTFVTFPLRLNFRQPGFRAKKGELNIPRSFIKI